MTKNGGSGSAVTGFADVTAAFYITAAIDYPLGQPHLGNAFEKIGADVQARYRRMEGYDTRLLLGSDEHTVLVLRQAASVGTPVVEYVEERAAQMRSAWRGLEISHDDFIQTSEPRHEDGCRQFLQRLYDAGFIYKRHHVTLYCENCEEYKTTADLRDGCCLNHPNVRAREVREENYFFSLSAFQEQLLELYRLHPDLIQPGSARSAIVAEVRRGLNDIAITRENLDWGIRAPFDPAQSIYVWVDALLSYVTAVGYGRDESAFAHWWPADIQVIGKDIAWFHCVLWPALLIAGGIEVPRRIQVHGLLLHDGEKMSKTLGNAVGALDLVDRFGVDAVRFFLMRECPFRGDANFSYERFVEVHNSDLVDKVGHLFDAAVSLSLEQDGGRVLGSGLTVARALLFAPMDIARLIEELHDHMERCEYDLALAKLVERVLDPATRYLAAERTQRSDEQRLHILIELVDALRISAIVLKPFMPGTAATIYNTFSFRAAFEALSLADAATPMAPPEAVLRSQLNLTDLSPLFFRAAERL
jgi:methionyl-tRNA synthetase